MEERFNEYFSEAKRNLALEDKVFEELHRKYQEYMEPQDAEIYRRAFSWEALRIGGGVVLGGLVSFYCKFTDSWAVIEPPKRRAIRCIAFLMPICYTFLTTPGKRYSKVREFMLAKYYEDVAMVLDEDS